MPRLTPRVSKACNLATNLPLCAQSLEYKGCAINASMGDVAVTFLASVPLASAFLLSKPNCAPWYGAS